MQSRVWEENIRWPWWLTLMILGLDLSIIIAIWAGLGNAAALIAAGSTILFTCYLFFITVLRTRVEGEYLSVGRARIEKKYLGKVITLSIDEFRHLRGAGINPGAFHAFRFWIKRGVKIEINDPQDPTPYWLVSSKGPEQFAEALKS